jgi:hypothetical protein
VTAENTVKCPNCGGTRSDEPHFAVIVCGTCGNAWRPEREREWNKAERLAVAAAVAPSLRSQNDKTKQRRVALVDESGNVTSYTTLGEVQKSLLRARAIELEVVDGVRPKEVICTACGKTIKVAQKGGGQPPKICRYGCDRRCRTEGCTTLVSVDSARRFAVDGIQRQCRPCTQREVVKKANASPKKAPALRAARDSRTKEQWQEAARKGAAGMSEAARASRAQKRLATIAAKSPEERAESHRRQWETRKAKKQVSA